MSWGVMDVGSMEDPSSEVSAMVKSDREETLIVGDCTEDTTMASASEVVIGSGGDW